MTNEKLTELLKIAYRWGRDNGSNRSEKNFNDLLQTEAINQALSLGAVVGQSEQLDCINCDYVRISDNTIECSNCGSVIDFAS